MEIKKFRRYNIFISSTFKDMNFERDILKLRVIPRVNERLREHNVEVYPLDLRLGINTTKLSQADASKKVLTECAMCIDESRPFFIGLIGGRYGWIPTEKEWLTFMGSLSEDDKKTMKETVGMSVTELEIEYGALSQKSLDNSRTLFFLRDPESHNDIPKEYRDTYCESDPEMIKKLNRIRERVKHAIRTKGGDDDFVIPYRLDWDKEANSFKDSDGENSFEELAYRYIVSAIEIELENNGDDSRKVICQEEAEHQESLLTRRLGCYSTALPYFDRLYENTVFCGHVGSGCTTILAHQLRRYKEETNDILLTATIGTSPLTESARGLLLLWAFQLEEETGEEHYDLYKLYSSAPFVEICDNFYYLVNKAAEQGRRVTVFIDDIQNFMNACPEDIYLAFLHPKLNVLGATTYDAPLKDLIKLTNLDFKDVELLPAKQQYSLIDALENRFHIEVSDKFRKAVTQKEHTPALLVALFRILSMSNGTTFDTINEEYDNFNEGVDDQILSLYKSVFCNAEADELLTPSHLLNIFAKLSGTDEAWYQHIFNYIASSPGGISRQDIEELSHPYWDAIEWSQYTHILQDYIEISFPDRKYIAKTRFWGFDDETPFDDLLDYIEFRDDNELRNFADYFMVHSESGDDYFEPEYLPLKKRTIALLLNEKWFTNGAMDKYIKANAMTEGDIECLLKPAAEELNKVRESSINQYELDRLLENILADFSPSDKNMLLSSLNMADKFYTDKLEALKSIGKYYSEDPAESKDPNLEAFRTYSRELYAARDSRNYIDELKGLEYLLNTLFNVSEQSRICDELLLELCFYYFAHIYGSAVLLRNSSRKYKDNDTLLNICEESGFAVMVTFLRLRFANPRNQAVAKAGIFLSLNNNLCPSFYDDYFYHSCHIYYAGEKLQELIKQL